MNKATVEGNKVYCLASGMKHHITLFEGTHCTGDHKDKAQSAAFTLSLTGLSCICCTWVGHRDLSSVLLQGLPKETG